MYSTTVSDKIIILWRGQASSVVLIAVSDKFGVAWLSPGAFELLVRRFWYGLLSPFWSGKLGVTLFL